MRRGYHAPLAEALAQQLEESAGVAQSVRVPACHAGGRGFEPRRSRHSFQPSESLSPLWLEDGNPDNNLPHIAIPK
jgi:hypothetical protein